jgi:DNA-binding transcriptional MerR regulator
MAAVWKRIRVKMSKTRKARMLPVSAEETYSSSEVARIAQVSLRQLQWWDEQNVVSPRHEGHKRVYLAQEVVEISLIAELRRKGFSLQKIRRVLDYLQRELGARLREVLSGSADLHLLTDGKSVYLERNHEQIIDILKNAMQPMFLVCVTDQVKRLSELRLPSATPRKPQRSLTLDDETQAVKAG